MRCPRCGDTRISAAYEGNTSQGWWECDACGEEWDRFWCHNHGYTRACACIEKPPPVLRTRCAGDWLQRMSPRVWKAAVLCHMIDMKNAASGKFPLRK